MLEQLKKRYRQYEIEAQKAAREAGTFLWGWGEDPRNDSCHLTFYEEVGHWVEEFLKRMPKEEELYAAAYWIISSAAEHSCQETYWYCYAAQAHCKQLVPLLSKEHRQELQRYFDEHYPRRDRLPVLKELYKLLSK